VEWLVLRSIGLTCSDSREIRLIRPKFVATINSADDDRRQRMNSGDSKRPKRFLSRTRIVMGLLLIVVIPIFIVLANKVVQENAGAIGQILSR
jgi:hypothetical protein